MSVGKRLLLLYDRSLPCSPALRAVAQVPKWSPITRETYLDRLNSRYDKSVEDCELAALDIFVSTADPEKEPPLTTSNVVLSVLAADYPYDK